MRQGKVVSGHQLHFRSAARLAAGLDQVTAAGLLGVGPRFLGELERGKATLRLGLALQVLERLGLELRLTPRGASAAAGEP